MDKKLTNSGPLRKPADKHSISVPCSSRQVFLTIPASLSGKVTFLEDDRPHDDIGMVLYGPSVKGCGVLSAAVPCTVFVSWLPRYIGEILYARSYRLWE